MNRTTRLAAVAAALAAVTGCSDGDSPTEPYDPALPTAWSAAVTNPWFPLTPGTVWRYRNETDDGVETIRGLRRQHPDARVIAVTGARGRFNRLTAARHVGADRTLLKPFGLNDLLTAVRDTLAN